MTNNESYKWKIFWEYTFKHGSLENRGSSFDNRIPRKHYEIYKSIQKQFFNERFQAKL